MKPGRIDDEEGFKNGKIRVEDAVTVFYLFFYAST